jgi:hypothetical protein
MASGKRGPSRPEGGRRPRPAPPTIDLKAEEVAAAETPAAPGESAVDPAAEGLAAHPAAEPPPRPANTEPPPFAAHQAPHRRAEEHRPQPRARAAWYRRQPWSSLGMAAAGAAAVLMVLGVLWLLDWSRGRTGPVSGDRLAGIEEQIAELSTRPAAPAVDAKTVEELAARLQRVETALAAPRTAEAKSIDALTARVGRIESALARPAAADPALAERINTVEQTVKTMADAVQDLRRQADAAAAAVGEVRAAQPGASAAEIDELTRRVAVLEKRADALAADVGRQAASTSAEDRAVRVALVAEGLHRAVESGRPFAAELAAMKPLAPNVSALAPLDPYASSGVPGAEALSRELTALLPSLRKTLSAAAEGGFLDRLQANAERLVRVQRVGEVPGDEPSAVLARVEARAARNDVAGALAELEKLPTETRRPAETWMTRARQRAAAIDASRRLSVEARAALGRPTEPGTR